MLKVQCPTAVPLCPVGKDGDDGLAGGGFHSDSHEELKSPLQTCLCMRSCFSKKRVRGREGHSESATGPYQIQAQGPFACNWKLASFPP